VKCKACDIYGPVTQDKHESAVLWNNRPIEDAQAIRIAELEKNQQDWDQCEVQLAEAVTDSEKRIAELETELSEARRLIAVLKAEVGV
jgi:phage shock protein A